MFVLVCREFVAANGNGGAVVFVRGNVYELDAAGVGFSAGCMIWIVFAELLPDAFEGAEDARAVATAATMSAAALEGFRMAMQRLDNEDGTLRAPTLKDFGLGGDGRGGAGWGREEYVLFSACAGVYSLVRAVYVTLYEQERDVARRALV